MADVRIRYVTEGAEQAQRELENIGAAAKNATQDAADSTKGVARAANDELAKLGDTLKESVPTAGGFKDKLDDIGAAALKLAGPIGAAATAIALLGVKMGLTGLKEADALGAMSRQTGISTEALSKFDYAAKLTDTSLAQVTGAIVRMRKELAKETPAKPLRDALEQIGLSADALKKLKPEQQVLELAKALEKLPAEDRVAQIQNIFGGRAGAGLTEFFGSSKDLKAAMDELERLGGVVTAKTAKDADTFSDSLVTFNTALAGIRTTLAADIAGDMAALGKALANLVKDSGAIKAFTVVLSALAKSLLFLVKVTATVLTALAATIGDAGVALGGFAASAAAFGKLEFRQGAEIIKQTMSDLAKRSQETEKAMREIWGLMKEAPEGLKETEQGAKAIKQSFTGAAGEARAMNAALREMSSLSSGLMTTGFIKTGPGGKNGVPNREDWNELLGEVRSFSREFSRELADMLTDAEREWEDFFKAIGSMISRIIIERTISRPLENAINSVLDSIFRGIGGAAGGGGVQTTALAGGGILPAGYVGLVGEAGPELLMPANQARRVVSNDDLGGGITINNNFSAGVSRADLMPILAQWRAQTVAAVYDANRRGI